MSNLAKGPLHGIRVVELATYVAAPTCARALADWGAEVIKVEAPRGDFMRTMGALVNMPIDDEENVAFDQQNSNKKGIMINLKEKEGVDLLHKLLSEADIFVTNNREDALMKMGISYPQLKEKYKNLVYGHLLGYGEFGPDKDKPGFDFCAYYARGGISGTLYEKGTSPLLTVAGFGDTQAGMFLAGGLCAALYKAKQTGQGEKVSVSLLHTGIFVMEHVIASSQYGNNHYPRSRKDTLNPLQGIYETKDGRWLQMAMSEYDRLFPVVCKMIGREDLLDCKEFLQFETVKENPKALIDILDEEMKKKDIAEWQDLFEKNDLPCDKAMLWEEILEDEQAWANEVLAKVGGYKNGAERIVVNTPVKFKEMGLPEFNKGPKPGEHTGEVLREYGYSQEQILQMKNQGTVR